MAELTNDDRAARAADALGCYCLHSRFTTDLRHPSVDVAELVGDFLGDLRHLCDRQAVDFAAADRHGQHHYEAERREGADRG